MAASFIIFLWQNSIFLRVPIFELRKSSYCVSCRYFLILIRFYRVSNEANKNNAANTCFILFSSNFLLKAKIFFHQPPAELLHEISPVIPLPERQLSLFHASHGRSQDAGDTLLAFFPDHQKRFAVNLKNHSASGFHFNFMKIFDPRRRLPIQMFKERGLRGHFDFSVVQTFKSERLISKSHRQTVGKRSAVQP